MIEFKTCTVPSLVVSIIFSSTPQKKKLDDVVQGIFGSHGAPSFRVDQSSVSRTEDDYVLRWASSGAGWKHGSNCGYTGAFAATGLITARTQHSQLYPPTRGSWYCHKKSPSSGRTYRESLIILSCWHDTDAALFFSFWLCRFSTQFFYSQKIFDILIEGNVSSVTGQYVRDWMNAYLSIQDRPLITAVCDGFNPISVIPVLKDWFRCASFRAL
jgi:hypothetical protein